MLLFRFGRASQRVGDTGTQWRRQGWRENRRLKSPAEKLNIVYIVVLVSLDILLFVIGCNTHN